MIRNVLYLHCHDAGRWLQPFDARFPAPHLAALAERGTRFTDAHCAAPTCSPSRAALLTGQWAHTSGMLGLAHRGFALGQPERHLAHVLGERGFHTHLSGVQHEFSYKAPKPYATISAGIEGTQAERDRAIAADAAAFLKGRSRGDRPFFHACGFFYPHREFAAKSGTLRPAAFQPPPWLPDTMAVRHDMACYAESARLMDACAGEVLEALRASEVADETLVVFTTDHGPAFPRMKCNLHASGTGVSLLIAGPGIPAGRAIDALVSHVDVFPTLCDLLGQQPPPWLQGTSLAPLLDGRATAVREETFAEVTYHAAYEPVRGIRTKRWNYVRRLEPRMHPVLPNCDDGYTKSECLSRGWRNQPQPREELYDLAADPHELRNVATDPAAQDALRDLSARLDAWMASTGDPALRGLPVPAPAGAVANPWDGLSPSEPLG